MTRHAERDRSGEHRRRHHRISVIRRWEVWAAILVAVGVVVAVAVVELPASPKHREPTALSNIHQGDGSGRSSYRAGTRHAHTPGAEAQSGVTIGSATGQRTTVTAKQAFSQAANSPDSTPVPSTFEPDLVQLYGSIYTAARVIPGLSRFARTESPGQLADLKALSARDESELYGAVEAGSGLKGLTSDVDSFIPAERATEHELELRPKSPATTPETSTPGSKGAEPHTSTSVTPQDLTTIPDTMPQTGSFGGGVGGTAYIANCPSYWSTSIDPYADNAIYALQIVIDVASGVYNAASTFDDAFPVSAIAAALTLVAQEVQNDGLYLKGDYEGCETNNVQEAGLDIDNSTYQTYELLASVAGTVNESDTNLAALINKNAADYEFQLEGVIEQALAQSATSAPMASLELPATAGGYLNSTPVGVQSVVSTEIANLEGAGQLTSPLAERDLGLAGQAYAAGEYKSAFSYYQLAYQEAAG